MKKLFFIMSNLQNHYLFKLDFQKVDQHTGGKWLIQINVCAVFLEFGHESLTSLYMSFYQPVSSGVGWGEVVKSMPYSIANQNPL